MLRPAGAERTASGEKRGSNGSGGDLSALVNSPLSKHFAKKQSMQWTPESAHLLLQTRTRTLDGNLARTFRRWYPAWSLETQALDDTPLAA